jgi:hypothetical protein
LGDAPQVWGQAVTKSQLFAMCKEQIIFSQCSGNVLSEAFLMRHLQLERWLVSNMWRKSFSLQDWWRPFPHLLWRWRQNVDNHTRDYVSHYTGQSFNRISNFTQT